jgi:hypothetical protein
MFGGKKELEKEGHHDISRRTDRTLMGSRQDTKSNEKTGQKMKEAHIVE